MPGLRARFFLQTSLVLCAACTSGPALGSVNISNTADILSELTCGVGLVPAEGIGWTVAYACVAEGDPTLHCSDIATDTIMSVTGDPASDAVQIELTSAAVTKTGTVPLANTAPVTADLAGVYITLTGATLGSGTFNVTTVKDTFSATFSASSADQSEYEKGAITNAPYCP